MDTAKMIEYAKKIVEIVFDMPVAASLLNNSTLAMRIKLLYPSMQVEPTIMGLPEKDKSQVFDLASKMIVARFKIV